MAKSSKFFLIVFFSLVSVVMVVSYYKYMVLNDYYIKIQTDCDPSIETCFVAVCEPSSDTECPSDPALQTQYYKFIEKKAVNIPLCNQSETDCPLLSCEKNEDCRVIFCDENIVPEGESCSDQIFVDEQTSIE